MNLSKMKIGGSLVIAGDLYDGKVVGITFEPAKTNFKKIVEQYKKGEKIALSLVAEPENKFDAHAVAVHANGLKVGYIPKEINKNILKHGIDKVKVELRGFNDLKPGDYKGMEINVAA
jgi:hypothetical protein